jgi:quinoprotein glucose dehydrogenase
MKTLLFIAQGGGGRGGRSGGGANFLRAFDKATGKVVAEIELPFMPFGSPMTYVAKGKQYIVLSLCDLRLAARSLP